MTLALAWLDGDVAYLCWDSAVTRIGGTVQVPISSFGEAQDVDGTPVEEGAIKLHQVAGLPVLIAGPVRRALACCDELAACLDRMSVREALDDIHPLFKNDEEPFMLIVAHRLDGRTVLTAYSSREGPAWQDNGWRVWVIGSLSWDLASTVRTAAHGAVHAMRDLSSEQKLMAVLATMQGLGIANYLPREGVGGAMCGARYDGAIHWQGDIVYLVSDPNRLARVTAGDGGVTDKFQPFHMVRCHVSDGVGVIISTLTKSIALLTSPRETRSEQDLLRIAKALPMPTRAIAPVPYYAYVDVSKHRVVLAIPRTTAQSSLSRVVPNGSELILKLGSDLIAKLKEPLTADRWELSVYREKETPGLNMFHVLMHLDKPK